jgi:uncharacterized protein (DUF1499 family)
VIARLTLVLLAVLLLVGIFAALAAWSRQPRPAPGLVDGHLQPCPQRPNCVSSEAGTERKVEPIPLPPGDAMSVLEAAVRALPRTTVATRGEGYLHAECRTAAFGFVDDLELRIDRTAGVVHVRSASRVGYSDRGENRRRVEGLRVLVAEAQP